MTVAASTGVGTAWLDWPIAEFRIKPKLIEAVRPQLESGEEVRHIFVGQRPVSPLAYLFVGQILFFFILKFKTVVATDRNVYVFSNQWMRSYRFQEGPPFKVALSDAPVELGKLGSLRVSNRPKIYVAPFGPLWRETKELAAYVESASAHTGQPVRT